ncbi:hypothetical protein, partial [Nocardia cyriacigeorgica]|uniref:hypothetical protein n=1 Tax=Nocardia cyriacigeorgica TaxID=135487 RepID=UPI0024562C28
DFAVIGMGRLGGMELGYGSDADVLFVCDPRPGEDETKAVRWATGIAERVQRMLGAPPMPGARPTSAHPRAGVRYPAAGRSPDGDPAISGRARW